MFSIRFNVNKAAPQGREKDVQCCYRTRTRKQNKLRRKKTIEEQDEEKDNIDESYMFIALSSHLP